MRFLPLVLLAAVPFAPAWGGAVLTLLPSSDISGLPGTLIGFGFSIQNDANYIEITSAQFCRGPLSFPACSLPLLGTFTDFISQYNDVVVGPPGGPLSSTLSQLFNPTLHTGIGSFAIAAGASEGAVDAGQIVLTYNAFDADPNGPGGANELLSDQVLSADATVTITATPEPGSITLVAGVLLAGLTKHRRVMRRIGRQATADGGPPATSLSPS